MYSANHWGGSFEINGEGGHEAEDDHSRNMDVDRGAVSRQLDETQASWLLGPKETKKKNKYIDLGCVVCKRKLFWWVFWAIIVAFIVIGLPIIIVKSIPKKKPAPIPPDEYAKALHKVLMFFNAQRCKFCLNLKMYYSYYEFVQFFSDFSLVSHMVKTEQHFKIY
jgi:endoglucanase